MLYSIKSHSSQESSEFNFTAFAHRLPGCSEKNLFIAIGFGDKTNWFLCFDISKIHPFRARKKKKNIKLLLLGCFPLYNSKAIYIHTQDGSEQKPGVFRLKTPSLDCPNDIEFYYIKLGFFQSEYFLILIGYIIHTHARMYQTIDFNLTL